MMPASPLLFFFFCHHSQTRLIFFFKSLLIKKNFSRKQSSWFGTVPWHSPIPSSHSQFPILAADSPPSPKCSQPWDKERGGTQRSSVTSAPNRQRTLNRLPPELRCRNLVTKHRVSTQVAAPNMRKRACDLHVFRLSFHFAHHRCWLGLPLHSLLRQYSSTCQSDDVD